MFFDVFPTHIRYIFHVKLQLFVTAKSDQDPDGSALVWHFGFGSALRFKQWGFPTLMKQEFFDTAMRKKIYTELDELQLDLDMWRPILLLCCTYSLWRKFNCVKIPIPQSEANKIRESLG